jgi:hypothetical protein
MEFFKELLKIQCSHFKKKMLMSNKSQFDSELLLLYILVNIVLAKLWNDYDHS